MSPLSRRSVLSGVPTVAATTALTSSRPGPAQEVRMTWFGISNWHYQIGDLGILVDGAVGYPAREPDPDMVRRVRTALALKGGTVDHIFLGHQHPDHSVDTREWARATGAPLVASQAACEEAVAYGVPRGQCVPVKGGEVLHLDKHVEVHVLKWVHSVEAGQSSGPDGGIETFGFLFKIRTPRKILTLFMSDSGAGGPELVKEHIVAGENRGAPLSNLGHALEAAGLSTFDVWQPGPESRLVTQARVLVPAFRPAYVMPHHIGARGGFNLLGGLHYAFDPAEMPKFMSVLDAFEVPLLAPVNYFDAWVYDHRGVRATDNATVKTSLGLPAAGPGPNPQGPNPRAGELEGPDD
ncbi:MAG TPA: hypothetical protein VIU15_27635 [Streptomyces sp.]